MPLARFEARMDSLFSFPVGLFHPLQHAGLSRRTTVCRPYPRGTPKTAHLWIPKKRRRDIQLVALAWTDFCDEIRRRLTLSRTRPSARVRVPNWLIVNGSTSSFSANAFYDSPCDARLRTNRSAQVFAGT